MRNRFKMLGWLVVIIAMVWAMSGCAAMTQIAKFDDQNAAATMAYGKQIMKHWGMNSQAIHIGISDEIISTKLPAEFGRSLKALDDMNIQFGQDQSAMTEADASACVMYLGKLIAPTIEALINQYAPDVWSKVLKYIPSFITL